MQNPCNFLSAGIKRMRLSHQFANYARATALFCFLHPGHNWHCARCHDYMLLKLLNAAFFHHTPAERTLNTENMHYSLVIHSKGKNHGFSSSFSDSVAANDSHYYICEATKIDKLHSNANANVHWIFHSIHSFCTAASAVMRSQSHFFFLFLCFSIMSFTILYFLRVLNVRCSLIRVHRLKSAVAC